MDMRPALLLPLLLLATAAPAAAQDNPLLSPPPTALPTLPSDSVRAIDLGIEQRRLENLDARGKLDPIEQRELNDLRAERHRVERALAAPAAPLTNVPDAQLNDTLRRDPLPGSGYPLGRLGRGGATLKPGSKPGEKPVARPAAPAAQQGGAPAGVQRSRVPGIEERALPPLPPTDRDVGGTRRYGFQPPAGDAGVGLQAPGSKP
jgi:hypothetical protein